MMEKEQVHQVMGHIDPVLIEEMDMPKKRRLPRALRTGLIAACVCLALVGTALAANEYRLRMALVEDKNGTSYKVTGSVTGFPESAFSDALIEASEARGEIAVVDEKFASWEDVQDFIGSSIDCVWPDGGQTWTGHYCVYLYHTEIDRLRMVEVESIDLSAQASVSVKIYTEGYMGDLNRASGGVYGVQDELKFQESYLMANGATAEIAMILGPEEYPDCQCRGYFGRAGILYSVTTYGSRSTQEETLSRLKTILDSFA